MILGCINRTAWGTKLLLTAVWASLVDCISSCHLLKARHGSFRMGALPRLRLPTRPHCPPTCPPPIDSIRDITETKKMSEKPAAFK